MKKDIIKKTTYTIESNRLPKEFDGFKIVQISDLHSYDTKGSLINLIDKPDIIVITGDLIDGRTPGMHCIGLLKQLSEIAPVYYITGNHEADYLDQYETVLKHVKDCVTVLHDDKIVLHRKESSINLIGLDDMAYLYVLSGIDTEAPDDRLSTFNMDDYSVVLLHNPANFDYISRYNPDLILSGHTHGGQIRLPLIGALYAPGQGLFPKFNKGVYKKGNSTLVINTGIGYSRLKIRLFCEPEAVEIVLKQV